MSAAELGLLQRALKRERAARREAEALIETRSRELYAAKLDAELATRVKTQMVSNVSHELKTPLNAIVGFSDLLISDLEDKLSATHLDYLTEIRTAGKHLAEVYNQLIEMSQLGLKTESLDSTRFNIAELMENITMLVHDLAVGAEIEIVPSVSADFDITASKPALTQALVSILRNAIKFSPAGSRVEISAENRSDNMVDITVRDYGIGMKPEEARLAVIPFYQVSESSVRAHGGVGLGLPIAKRLIELHQGTLTIDTSLEIGTSVSVRFPRHPVDVADKAAYNFL
jgi:two-component system cell cycle sensor histidine kinase PleC